jgi:hypothetical protein
MIGFAKEHRQIYRVRREEGSEHGDPYGFLIRGTYGDLYVHGPGMFGVATHKAGGIAWQIRRLPFVKMVQDGDDGINATFAAEHLDTIAKLVKSRIRPRLTPEQRAAKAEALKDLGLNGQKPRSDSKSGPEHHPGRPNDSGAAESHISPGLPAGA